MTDPQLYDRLREADAILLPYAWGSHSGFIELALDLAAPAFIYDTGHYKDQCPAGLISYSLSDEALLAHIIAVVSKVNITQWNAPTHRERDQVLHLLLESYSKIYRLALDR